MLIETTSSSTDLPPVSESRLCIDLRSYCSEGKQHSHNHHQLVLPLEGQLLLSVENEDGEVDGEHAGVILAGHTHGFFAPAPNQFLVVDLPEADFPSLTRLPAFPKLSLALLRYIQFLHTDITSSTSSSSTRSQMLLLLIQLFLEQQGERFDLDRRIITAKQYLEANYHRRISTKELAAVAHLSTRQLNDLFRGQLGTSPYAYLTSLRMQESKRLLEQSDLSIQRIADLVGYTSLSAFSDRFSRYFGKSPRFFRRNPQS